MPVSLGVAISHMSADLLDRDYVHRLAALLEQEECESVWIGDHPALGRDSDGRTFPSPLEWLTLFAAHSTTIKLGTAVIVLPYQHPIVLAKRIATLDRLSGGRVIVGVGLGSNDREAASLDIDLSQRAGVTTESIEVMRAIWTAGDRASFDGRFFSFHDVDPTPRPAQPLGPPITIGGDSLAAARRAGRLGHGLIPLGCEPERIQLLIDVARTEAVHGGWDTSLIELTVQFDSDPSGLRRLLDTGASRVVVNSPTSGDLGELRDAVKAAKDLLASAK
ncbi:MAG: TIGR03619 family F420-dependent LLM class oxidoreductase [Acidimicrobiales bacterium]